jgi:hypothetical protein
MNRRILAAALTLGLALALTSCSDDPAPIAADPGGDDGATPTAPTAPPAAPGQVRSRNLATVMDRDTSDDEVELCLGAVAESYPPQCGGPFITNWDWDAADVQGMYDEQGSVRWGTFAVTGTWDGTAFSVDEVIPGPLYDPMVPEEPNYPEPEREYTDPELQEISDGLADEIAGYQGSYPDQDGHVIVDVTYDDGSIADYVDATYGANVVIINGALIDVE